VADAARKILIEEFRDGPDATLTRHLRNIRRRFDAEMTDATLCEVTKHDPVIASDLADERIIRCEIAIANEGCEAGEMPLHPCGCRREKCVVLVKHPAAIDELGQLHHRTLRTVRDP